MQKSLIAFIILFLIQYHHSHCQNIEIGIEAGPNLSSLRDFKPYSEENQMPKVGYTVGIDFVKSISKKIDLKSGLYYQNIGTGTRSEAMDTEGNMVGKIDINVNLHYMTLALGINLYPLASRTLFIYAGGFLGYNIKNTYSIASQKGISEHKSEAYKGMINKLNAGLSLGLGYSFKISDEFSIIPSLRQDFGLTSISDSIMGSPKTNAFNLLIAFNYLLK